MNSRTTRAIVGLAVGLAAVATPAIALASTSGPTAGCGKGTPGGQLSGVVTRPENPSDNKAKPSESPSATATATIKPSDTPTATITPSDTATATVAPKPKPAANVTFEIRVTKAPKGKPAMGRHTYTVVDCTGHPTAMKRGDTATITYSRVRGDSHRLYASTIVVKSAAPKPTGKPTPKPSATATATASPAKKHGH